MLSQSLGPLRQPVRRYERLLLQTLLFEQTLQQQQLAIGFKLTKSPRRIECPAVKDLPTTCVIRR